MHLIAFIYVLYNLLGFGAATTLIKHQPYLSIKPGNIKFVRCGNDYRCAQAYDNIPNRCSYEIRVNTYWYGVFDFAARINLVVFTNFYSIKEPRDDLSNIISREKITAYHVKLDKDKKCDMKNDTYAKHGLYEFQCYNQLATRITIDVIAKTMMFCEVHLLGTYVPIDGDWSAWDSWTDCSPTCGSLRSKTRHRRCDSPAPNHGGKTCNGSDVETAQCTPVGCPVDGAWGCWRDWSDCSATCGSRRKTRERECDSPPPSHGGSVCPGPKSETTLCSLKHCPVNGMWGEWSENGKCSVTCGSGVKTLSRYCDKPAPAHEGSGCVGAATKTEVCDQDPCPINGGWGSWLAWSECSASCGSQRTKSRQRLCDSPPPTHGGNNCTGPDTDTVGCSETSCPVDGMWGRWEDTVKCSVTCGSGIKTMARYCDSPFPAYGGLGCIGGSTRVRVCYQDECPVNGGWSSWNEWSDCSASCGEGMKTRQRQCNSPPASHGGSNCPGLKSDSDQCSLKHCPVNGMWGEWSENGQCSVTCGSGIKSRARYCDSPAPEHGGSACVGSTTAAVECSEDTCQY